MEVKEIYTDQQKRILKRNNSIRLKFSALKKEHKEWRYDAIIKHLEDEFFLAKRTISAIINYEYEKALEKKYEEIGDKENEDIEESPATWIEP